MTISRNLFKAFSLVEIMVVIAIVALFAAIAIPSMLRTKLNENEKTAQAALREISKACESYRMTQHIVTYPRVIDDIIAGDHQYCDPAIFDSNGFKGYIFTFSAGPDSQGLVQNFDCSARPLTDNITGIRWFVIDETGVLREDRNADGIADASDTAIQD